MKSLENWNYNNRSYNDSNVIIIALYLNIVCINQYVSINFIISIPKIVLQLYLSLHLEPVQTFCELWLKYFQTIVIHKIPLLIHLLYILDIGHDIYKYL